ncbi:unnamed protein product [Kuraishia capsulata CBS 1993]|uniref:Peroxisomal ATPase PEX1 n=1 Tax=Kuraishia capsulata CBS 1993 TaxID=1382522 RepID=W6MKW9_9ASCO|nr:uncharacterized protein KUCA_T00002682001 [Kuraishia capsulata CBS 1993]CDK26708.1 unnamed protein product [Kuraishia capsulata CBS 1993]
MDQVVQLVVKPLRSNLVNLPIDVADVLLSGGITIQDVVVELQEAKAPSFYVGWTGGGCKNGTIEMDRDYAESLGLKPHTVLLLKCPVTLEFATTVELEPASADDWEWTETYAQNIENTFLNTTRCVTDGLNIIAFPNPLATAKLKVISITSKGGKVRAAKLVQDTELHIAPRARRRQSANSSNGSGSQPKTRQRSISSSARRSLPQSGASYGLARSIPLPHPKYKALSSGTLYEIYVNRLSFPNLGTPAYVQVSVVAGPGMSPQTGLLNKELKELIAGSGSKNLKQNGTDASETAKSTGTTLETGKIIAQLTPSDLISKNDVAVSRMMAIALGIDNTIGDLLLLEPSRILSGKTPSTLVIHKYITSTPENGAISLKANHSALRVKLSELLDSMGLFSRAVLTNGMKLPSLDEHILPHGGILEFKNSKAAWLAPMAPEISRTFKIEIGEDLLRPESFIPGKPDKKLENDEVVAVGQSELISKVIRTLKRSSSGVLLHGASGSGKTLLSHEIAKQLYATGYYISFISCESLPADFAAIKTMLEKTVNEATWRSPTLLVLENLDSMFPAQTEHSDTGVSTVISGRLASMVSSAVSSKKLSILATSRSKQSVNDMLFSTRILEEDFILKAPEKNSRRQLLESYLMSLDVSISSKSDLLKDIAIETEGYLAADLRILAERAHHNLLNDIYEQDSDVYDLEITNAHFQKALQGYVPSSLRGAKLQKPEVDWLDVGGLREAKSILLETLEWPTRYAPIFANCPLRLRSGILLYGYPGCGKTLLASAIASQCGLNFISIKGPEILNKYIGASEQSVRELFERAQAAKPCILFFDEFDSIAPKRGHDSTGVTDRVVNQMLTQIDGAEGLDGVYVLAATSRPDLIDSALLRPGRLDKSVICDMPDAADRLDILKSVTRNMTLSADVNLADVSKRCPGFSGADLQALSYNAYLRAVHTRLARSEFVGDTSNEANGSKKDIEFFSFREDAKSNSISLKPKERAEIYKRLQSLTENSVGEEKKEDSNGDLPSKAMNTIHVTNADFEFSLKETKPSISVSEQRKLQAIYSQFINGRDGNMKDGSASNKVGARSTLM